MVRTAFCQTEVPVHGSVGGGVGIAGSRLGVVPAEDAVPLYREGWPPPSLLGVTYDSLSLALTEEGTLS